MATLLDNDLVTDALKGLDEWTGDTSGISRTVTLDGGDAEQLLADVSATADTMNHHPDVDRNGKSVTFRLSTHSEGGVTELDIALASRIDDLIRKTQPEDTYRHGGVQETSTAQPSKPGEGTTPSTSKDSATGADDAEGAAGLMHPPANPREGAGPILAPDTKPGTPEPMPRPDGGPGMHEPAPDESET